MLSQAYFPTFTVRSLVVATLLMAGSLQAQTSSSSKSSGGPEVTFHRPDWRKFQIQLLKEPFQAKYSRRGLELQDKSGRFTSRIRWRVQVRDFDTFNEDPRRVSQFGQTTTNHFLMQRARFKVEGRMFGKLVNYKYEQDLVGGRMIDLYADFNLKPWFKIRAGQWKSVFSQERYISSGSQQLADRSIVNREFTVDRQSGAMAFGRVGSGKRWDSSYFLEVLGGSGINSVYKDGSPMVVGRYQWNMFGREPEFASSDIEGAEHPEAFLAVTGLHNRSRYTRFSSSGGGQLDGFAAGLPGQYSLKQANVEFLLKYRGLSIQNENHVKNVRDNLALRTATLRGSYIQTGYFPHHVWRAFPADIELAYRWGAVDSRVGVPNDLRQEHTIGANFFLEGHTDKFTVDFSRISLARAGLSDISDHRVRVQWDVHF